MKAKSVNQYAIVRSDSASLFEEQLNARILELSDKNPSVVFSESGEYLIVESDTQRDSRSRTNRSRRQASRSSARTARTSGRSGRLTELLTTGANTVTAILPNSVERTRIQELADSSI